MKSSLSPSYPPLCTAKVPLNVFLNSRAVSSLGWVLPPPPRARGTTYSHLSKQHFEFSTLDMESTQPVPSRYQRLNKRHFCPLLLSHSSQQFLNNFIEEMDSFLHSSLQQICIQLCARHCVRLGKQKKTKKSQRSLLLWSSYFSRGDNHHKIGE